MDQPQESSVPTFDNLPATQPITQQLITQIDVLLRGNWADSFQCITALRSINKFYPESILNVINRYLPTLCQLINSGKTQVVKNAFSLIREVLSRGKMLNVESCVLAFAGMLIKKTAMEHGHLKQMAREALDEFVNNCGYDVSFTIVAENCGDKNVSIPEVSIRLLAKLIENLGVGISQLKPQTLQKIMKALVFLLDGKRQNTKNWALEICMYVFNLIGSQNYLNLMTYVLSQQQIQIMSNAMNQKNQKSTKQSVPALSTVLKERKSIIKQYKQGDQNNNSMNQAVFQNINNCQQTQPSW